MNTKVLIMLLAGALFAQAGTIVTATAPAPAPDPLSIAAQAAGRTLGFEKPAINQQDVASVIATNSDLVPTPEPSTVVFVSTAVLVGFVVRCRRKGLPFRTPKA